MNTWTLRLGMSLMVVVALWADRLPAQEPALIVPVVPYEPAHHPMMPAALSFPGRPAPPAHAVHRFLYNHGMNCGVDSFYPLCGNAHYEAHFIFGSCRSFFLESCPPNSSCGRKNCNANDR